MRTICLLSIFVAYCHLSYAQSTTHKLVLDHIIIWTEKDAPEKKLFEENGFISKSDAVQLHNGFGTAGKYISTYNLLLEFLYINDKANYYSNYHKTLSSRRDDWRKNKKCPFGIAFEMIPFDSTKIPFDNKEVRAAWMHPNEALYTATSNYTYDQEPILFMVNPNLSFYPKFNRKEDFDTIANELARSSRRKYRTHPNGAEKLTNIKVTCNTKQFSPTVEALRNVENLQIVKGKEHLMEMTFDNNRQNKTIDFRPQLAIVIKY